MLTAGVFLILELSLLAGSTSADEHLLAGARSFREGRFDVALVEFQNAQALGSSGAAGYAAAALVKLGRPEEAIESFGGIEAPERDALLDYYLALACYEARLYQCADRILAKIGDRSGPRIAEQAKKIRQEIAALFQREPTQSSIDWYVSICSARMKSRRSVLAYAYCREAALLADKRKDHYQRSVIAGLRAQIEQVSSSRTTK